MVTERHNDTTPNPSVGRPEFDDENGHVMLGNRDPVLSSRILADLTQLMAANRDLPALVERLAILVGNPIMVCDQLFQVLAASSNTPPEDSFLQQGFQQSANFKAVTRDHTLSKLLDTLQQDMKPVVLPARPQLGLSTDRIMIPILGGKEPLGYLAMLKDIDSASEYLHGLLQETASVFSIELNRIRESLDVEIRLTSNFLSDLLDNDSPNQNELIHRASFLDMDLRNPWSLMVLSIDDIHGLMGATQTESQHKARYELVEILRKISQSETNVYVVHGENIVAFTPTTANSNESDPTSDNMAEMFHQNIRDAQMGTTVTIAYTHVPSEVNGFKIAYDKAEHSIRISRNLGIQDRTVKEDMFGIYGLLYRVDEPDSLIQFADRLLSPLVEYDQKRNTRLMLTIESYLDENGAFRKTARNLYIHLNTLRGRLERIEQICGIKLADSTTRFNLQLSLEIYRAHNRLSQPETDQRKSD